MSLALWSKQKYPGSNITRSENIWNCDGKNWNKYHCMAITRDPIQRIKSGIQYWPEIEKIYNDKGIDEVLKGIDRYDGVGFGNPIKQSDYDRYIEIFENKFDVKIEVYRFEDIIKDNNFPHINESNKKIKLSNYDIGVIKDRLKSFNVNYFS